MRTTISILVFIIAISIGALAQSGTTINGNEHPELIPDNAAALAVFVCIL